MMARFIAMFALFLAVFVTIASCDNNVAKYCNHIRCTRVDKECTKPLKPRSFCWCQKVSGKLELRYGVCPGKKVFNGKNDKCQDDSETARAHCKRQTSSG
uniref:Putative conserved plasma membrane protein n=2 Tax=Culex tarsalis TaxID=7177 RepID=A0A1Q3FTP2_CULTA